MSSKVEVLCAFTTLVDRVGAGNAMSVMQSAPDMQEALEACVTMYGDENPDDDWTAIQKARGALAKSRGQT